MFGFCGVLVLVPPFTLWLVVLVQNDSKARAGVGAGVEGRRSWMVSPLIHLHKGGLSFLIPLLS